VKAAWCPIVVIDYVHQLAVPLLEPNPFAAMAPLKMRYLTAAGMWHLETFLSPLFLIQRRLPPATLQYNRQLYPNSGLQGYIAASSGPSPSLVLGVTNPVGFDFYKSSQIPRSEDEEGLADVPSVPRAGLAVFTRGSLFSDYGVTLAGMGSNVKAEWGVDFEEAAIELRAGGYLRMTGDIEWNVTGIWKWRPQDSLGATGIVLHGQQDTSLLATVALTLEGVLLRFEAQYLGQKFTLPIVLSNFSDDRLALWFTLVPATATALYYSFFTRPRSRTRRARCGIPADARSAMTLTC
jgi:DnaJ family protein C protein 11